MLGLAVFSILGFAVRALLSDLHFGDVRASLEMIPVLNILIGTGFTAAAYFMYGWYEILAGKLNSERKLSNYKTWSIGLLSFSIGNNVNIAGLGAGAIRYRLYSSLGYTLPEIGKIIFFSTSTVWLGLFFILGMSIFAYPTNISNLPWQLWKSGPSLPSSEILASIFLILIVAYFLSCHFFKKEHSFFGVKFQLPSVKLAIIQILFSGLNWSFSCLALYFLMPQFVGNPLTILPIFLIAQLAGAISQIPGGVGVFETIFISQFGGQTDSAPLLAALLVFRFIFYIVPLMISLTVLLVSESKASVAQASQLKKVLKPLTIAIPNLIALQVFATGAMLIGAGAVPTLPYRLSYLEKLVPLALLEISHFLASIFGLILLILAFGIHRRQKIAYKVTQIVLILGAILALARGFEFEQALLLAIVFCFLRMAKHHFYRLSDFGTWHFSKNWLFYLSATMMLLYWVLLFSSRETQLSNELWWQVALSKDLPRGLRASLGVAIFASAFLIWQLVRPKRLSQKNPIPDFQKLLPLIKLANRANASLALLGDKNFVFSQSEKTFIMYGIKGRSWIALGDPVGPEEEWQEVLWKFKEMVDLNDGKIVFYQIKPENFTYYLDLGLKFFKLGEEAMIPISNLSLEGPKSREYRGKVNKLEKESAVFEILSGPVGDETLFRLQEISDDWLSNKKTHEKGFSLGRFDQNYLRDQDFAVVKHQGAIVAFANIWKTADKSELSVDLIRYHNTAPKGVMDYLFVRLMLWGKDNEFKSFSLGMAPLSGLSQHPLTNRWNKAGGLLFRHGEHFYNFEGLRNYKSKFDPKWEPRYLATESVLLLPLIFMDLASLISGGLLQTLKK